MAKRKSDTLAKIYIVGEISEGALSQFHKDLDATLRSGPECIVVEISSAGGDFHIGMAIAARIKASPVPVFTLVSGLCMSAAVPIAAVGVKRFARPWSTYMVHQLSMSAVEYQTRRLASEIQQMQEEQKLYCEVLADHSKVSAEDWQSRMITEFYFDPKTAMALGLVDEVVEKD